MNPKHLLASLIFWIFALNLWLPATAQNGLPINVGSDKTARDSLFVYKQEIRVDGTAEKDITAVSGDVHVRGRILGNISVLSGNIYLYPGALVKGDIVCVGGNLKREEPCEVLGRVTTLFSPQAGETPPWFDSKWAEISFVFAHSLLLFLLVALCFYSFPNQVNEAAFQLSQDLTRAAIIGVLVWALLLILYILSFLLMVVAIGFPLFLITLTATVVIGIFGIATVFYQFGQAVEHISKGKITLALGIVGSILIASLLTRVPYLGPLTYAAIAVFGAGIVIETRFGTNKQWFTRKARYWAA